MFECRTTGTATAGGAFVAGSTGTDYSQQNSPQIAVTDAVANGTTTITSATAAFTSAHVGNLIYLAGGTGSLTGTRRHVVSVTNATDIVVDATVATGTGITLNLGGALDHPKTAAPFTVASNKVFVKSGTYTITATMTFSGTTTPSATEPPCLIRGYGTTRGDSGTATILMSTTTGMTGIACGAGWFVENMIVNCASLTPSVGISVAGYSAVTNCKTTGHGQYGINCTGDYGLVQDCEVTSGVGGFGIVMSTNAKLLGCHVHDNVGIGATVTTGAVVLRNIIANNTGGSADGLQVGYGCVLDYNTIYGNGRHGIHQASNGFGIPGQWRNNILAGNGGYGAVGATATGNAAAAWWDGNAYWSNTSGNRSNMDDTTTNPVNGAGAYTNTLDLILTADPFVAKASGDFRLNTTSGGGLAARAEAEPQTWLGNSLTVSEPDFGAAQHVDSGGGGTVPSEDDVRFGVAVGATTGTLTLPTEAQVESGVDYGADGIEFTGTLTGGGGGGMTLADLQGELTTRGLTGAWATATASDLNDIQARLPAALVSGRIDASVGAVAAAGTPLADIAAAVRDVSNASPAADSLGAKVNTAAAGGGGGATADAIADAVWAAQPAGTPLEDISAAVVTDMDTNSAKLAMLDATISSRAPATTALSNATWTNAIATDLIAFLAAPGVELDEIGVAVRDVDNTSPAASSLGAAVNAAAGGGGGNVTVGGYASGQSPADLVLATPAQKIATDGTGRVDINLGQVGLTPRALDSIADGALTVGDALVGAVSGAAGKESISGTSYVIKTPSTGTVIRTFVLNSSTLPTGRN